MKRFRRFKGALQLLLFLTACLELVMGEGECDTTKEELIKGCEPCPGEKWQNMVSEKDSAVPSKKCQELSFFTKGDLCDVTDSEDCFNNDPLKSSSDADDEQSIATGEVTLDKSKSRLGFSIPKVPFFRYFLPPGSRDLKDYSKFDIGLVKDYYINEAAAVKFDTDFELFEWPGTTADQHNEYLEEASIPQYGCFENSYSATTQKCIQKHEFVMLAFDRDNTKFLNYPCNTQRGTYVTAYGNVRPLPAEDPDELRKVNGEATQKIWLTHGKNSIHKDYIHPLSVRKATLEELRSEKSGATSCTDIADLRTVMDFTFTTDRLVLGMKCGIIVVQNVFEPIFFVTSAKVRKAGGLTSAFDQSINKISGSVCCSGSLECHGVRNIIAAYSFDAERKPDDLKFLYVSFDLGDTFEQKYIGSVTTLINLIKSLYGMYERWDEYYKYMMENSDDKEIFGNLPEFPVWKYLNVEEKEAFITKHASGLGGGVALEGFKKIKLVFCDKVNEIIEELGDEYTGGDFTPKWVQAYIDDSYKELGFDNKTECDKDPICSDQFEDDKVVKEIMQDYYKDYKCMDDTDMWKEKTVVQTRKRKPSETYCLEITSLTVVQEEQNLLALCKVGFCKSSGGSDPPDCSAVPEGDLYAVFEIPVSPSVPVAYPIRRSKRIFECKLVNYGLMMGHMDQIVQPELIRVPKSASIFIVNCAKVIYFSVNAGRTIFNAAFYYKRETENTYVRSYTYEKLTVPPCVAIDTVGHSIMLTFKNYYAFGVINYNRELRLLVGITYDKGTSAAPTTGPGPGPPPPTSGPGTAIANLNEGEVVAIPWYTNSGEVAVSLALLGIIGREPEYKDFYQHRNAIRLVQLPISLYKDIVPFYSENLNVNPDAKAKHQEFQDCETFAFSYGPKTAKLDIYDSAVIEVQVTDVNRFLPLGIFSDEEHSLVMEVKSSNRSKGHADEIIRHDWDVTITALPYRRPKVEALIDAFFGTEYSNLNEYSVNVVLVNLPTIRCHVQPSGSVLTQVGCLGKTFVAHEDEHRPQCKSKFIKNKEYIIERGMYDPELARYWIENNPEFVRRNPNGDLNVTYDYSTFGCPLEPYREDAFSPDLRILSEENRRNTSLGDKFGGDYILIEIFGAQGYDHLFNVGDVGCKRRPQTNGSMIRDWMIRRRIFNISEGRMVTFTGDERIGNLLFDGQFVNEHLNIWNRVNYESCLTEDPGEPPLTDEDKAASYEIMNNQLSLPCDECSGESVNKIIWDSNKRPSVFIFLAVAVDSDGTLCNHYTMFGVSLPKAHDLEDLKSFLVFVFFVLLWIFLVLLGYWCRKSYLRKAYIYEARSERLKQAAWTVIYRYEKLLHENENKDLETEITDFTRALDQKERQEGYEKIHKDNPKLKVEEKNNSKRPTKSDDTDKKK